jgi:opacity protein-like surface antigen
MRALLATACSLLFALSAVVAAPAVAQDTRVEITPFGGWRWGGELEAGDNVLFDRDVDVDESGVYGLRLDVAVNRNFQIELQASRQQTEFTTGDDDLFGDDTDLLDVDIDTLQVGMLFQGGDGQIHPFGVVGLGLTRLDPDGSFVESDERLSASFGGGVKVFVSRNVGFRFEGRYYWTDTEEDDGDDDFFGGEDDDDLWEWDGDLYQGEVTVGLIVAM